MRLLAAVVIGAGCSLVHGLADDITVYVDPENSRSMEVLAQVQRDESLSGRHRVWPFNAARHPFTARMNRVRKMPTVIIERNGIEIGRLVDPDPVELISDIKRYVQ